MEQEIINAVWQKGAIVAGNDSNRWRKDICGAWIGYGYYGNRNSQYGWEIDHIKAESNYGSDDLNNLRPLHWLNNARKSDGSLIAAIIASGVDNVRV